MDDFFDIGGAMLYLAKSAADKPVTSYGMTGKLYLSKSGWILLSVPNDIGKGAFAALNEPGAELPTMGDDGYNAHISVIRPEEMVEAGIDPADITERGKEFSYTLGPVRTVRPAGWGEMSKVWYIEVSSPELKQLRKSYGLTPLPNNNEHQFHISFAVRRTGVLGPNPARRKAASAGDLARLAIVPGILPWVADKPEQQVKDAALAALAAGVEKYSSGPHRKDTATPCSYSDRMAGTCTNRSPRVKDRNGGGSSVDSLVAVSNQAQDGPDLSEGSMTSNTPSGGGAGGGGGGGDV